MCLGLPARVITLHGETTCVVEIDGRQQPVDLSMLEDEGIGPGDWLYVHSGFALERLSAEEAHSVQSDLAALAAE